ncbi:MAG: SemiSWEET family transporter [Patescibacteria group bacterium]
MVFKNLVNFFQGLIEYRDFIEHGHFTSVSIVVLIALLTAIIQAWGMLKQSKKIWQNQSGETLPLTFFAFQFFYFMSYLIYGIKIGSGSIILNNLVGFFFLPIIAGLIKFKLKENGSFRKELLFSPFFVLVIPCILFIKEEWSLLVVLVLALFVFTHLVRELFRTKKVRNIEPRFILSIIAGSSIWLFYGWKIGDFGIAISSGTTIIGGMFFYYYYRRFKSQDTF